MDKETKEIISDNKWVAEIIGHQGWKIVRQRMMDKILDLQNAFNIDDSDPQKMLIDLQARKLATTMLFDFLRDIESSKDIVEDNAPIASKSYVVQLE